MIANFIIAVAVFIFFMLSFLYWFWLIKAILEIGGAHCRLILLLS